MPDRPYLLCKVLVVSTALCWRGGWRVAGVSVLPLY